MTHGENGMARSSAEFFRGRVAECDAAAQSAKDPIIKQAYLELAQGWRALADEIERLRSQVWRPQVYSGHALPRRSLDDFYELRTPQSGKRAVTPALEHPTLDDWPGATAKERGEPQPSARNARTRRADSL
ncbi:MAG TPA: hypothetical protein VMA30_11370 [Xanthobacteraceae bacterium]|nr:hypothetical protein [Xanthobacteraceae bacterium]